MSVVVIRDEFMKQMFGKLFMNSVINHVIFRLSGYNTLLSFHHTHVTNVSVHPGTRLSLVRSMLVHSSLGSKRSSLNKQLIFHITVWGK